MTQGNLPIQEIVDAYLAGEHGPTLAARYMTSSHAIYKLLRTAGVEIRSKGGSVKAYDQGWSQAFIDAYKAGMPICEIAQRMGVGHGTVWRALKAGQVVRRPQGLKKLSVKIPESPAMLGYFAGLLDGEGNLSLKRSRGRRTPLLNYRLSIYNTHAGVLDWLAENFGGTVTWRERQNGWKSAGRWNISRILDIHAVLTAVQPYLIVKADAADTILAVLKERHDLLSST